MSKSDKNHNHSHQDKSKKNIKIAFFINYVLDTKIKMYLC